MQISLPAKLLLGITVAVVGYVLVGPGDEQTVQVAKSSDQPIRVTRASRADSHHRDPARMLYSLAHRVAAASSADTLFAAHAWFVAPPPPPPAPVLTAPQEAAPKAPVAPPVPFVYMGTYAADGSEPVFFLTQGDRVYNVRVGDSLNDTYSVDSFTNGQLVLTYKPLKIQQQLTVGSGQ
jgi:hypothetical protein